MTNTFDLIGRTRGDVAQVGQTRGPVAQIGRARGDLAFVGVSDVLDLGGGAPEVPAIVDTTLVTAEQFGTLATANDVISLLAVSDTLEDQIGDLDAAGGWVGGGGTIATVAGEYVATSAFETFAAYDAGELLGAVELEAQVIYTAGETGYIYEWSGGSSDASNTTNWLLGLKFQTSGGLWRVFWESDDGGTGTNHYCDFDMGRAFVDDEVLRVKLRRFSTGKTTLTVNGTALQVDSGSAVNGVSAGAAAMFPMPTGGTTSWLTAGDAGDLRYLILRDLSGADEGFSAADYGTPIAAYSARWPYVDGASIPTIIDEGGGGIHATAPSGASEGLYSDTEPSIGLDGNDNYIASARGDLDTLHQSPAGTVVVRMALSNAASNTLYFPFATSTESSGDVGVAVIVDDRSTRSNRMRLFVVNGGTPIYASDEADGDTSLSSGAYAILVWAWDATDARMYQGATLLDTIAGSGETPSGAASSDLPVYGSGPSSRFDVVGDVTDWVIFSDKLDATDVGSLVAALEAEYA